MPILQKDGETPYEPQPGDVVALQVRKDVVTGATNTEPELVIDGNIIIQDGEPVWVLSPSDTTIPVGKYKWDVQITLGGSGDVVTYNSGTFKITSEVTIPHTNG